LVLTYIRVSRGSSGVHHGTVEVRGRPRASDARAHVGRVPGVIRATQPAGTVMLPGARADVQRARVRRSLPGLRG